MKFIVDQLPYYGDICPWKAQCNSFFDANKCPIWWDKDKVCSDENPHECEFLIERENK